jgi:hypothetical protein
MQEAHRKEQHYKKKETSQMLVLCAGMLKRRAGVEQ